MGIEDLGLLLENIEEYVMVEKKVVSMGVLGSFLLCIPSLTFIFTIHGGQWPIIRMIKSQRFNLPQRVVVEELPCCDSGTATSNQHGNSMGTKNSSIVVIKGQPSAHTVKTLIFECGSS